MDKKIATTSGGFIATITLAQAIAQAIKTYQYAGDVDDIEEFAEGYSVRLQDFGYGIIG